MIAKKIGRTVKGKFGCLSGYIAAAKEKGEKLVDLWTVNCAGGDEVDLDLAIAEALGFGEHQRVAGTHENTDNFHMHVAINRVHPGKLTVHTPWNDYKALERTCRAMERKYGLHVDLGGSDYDNRDGKGRAVAHPAARDFEARTWRQSFQNHVLDNRKEILGIAGKARTWRELHQGLAAFDIEIKRRGAGLALKRRDGPEVVKASLAGPDLTFSKLKERLGPYESMDKASASKPRRRYSAKPLTRHPGASRLWRTFTGRRRRPKTLAGRIAADWKQFLINEAYRDPLALVVIMTYKKMFRAFGDGGRDRLPRTLRPALRHWIDAGKWADGTAGPWVKEKGGARSLGLREDGSGNLMVPFRGKDGHVWGLQVLKPDGKTTEIGNLGKKGLLHVIDPERRIEAGGKPPAVVLTDNIAAAAAVRNAAHAPVALVPKGGDLKAAAACLRAKHADCKIAAAGAAAFAERARAVGVEALEVKEWNDDRTGTVKPADLRARLAPLVGDKAQMAWTELKGAPWTTPGNTPWLMENRVRGFGLKLAPDGGVAMPLKDVHGRLHDVKFIARDGGTRRAGRVQARTAAWVWALMHVIDPGRRAGKDAIVVAGDYLSGAAIHKATRLPVAVAEEADKMGDLARALRERYPDGKLVIAADKERAGSLKESAGETRATLAVPEGAASFAERAGDPDKIRDVLARPAGDAVWLRWRNAEPLGKDGTPQGLPPGLPVENLRRDKHVLVPLTDASGRVWGSGLVFCPPSDQGEVIAALAISFSVWQCAGHGDAAGLGFVH